MFTPEKSNRIRIGKLAKIHAVFISIPLEHGMIFCKIHEYFFDDLRSYTMWEST